MASHAPRRFLPQSPNVEEPYRLTPKLALRVGVLVMLALAVFAVLFLRLWALEVLSGSQYLRTAQDNQLRSVRVQAPRGPILDRNGKLLVTNKAGLSVEIWPADLPRRGRYAELQRLSKVVGVPATELAAAIEKRKGDVLTPVRVQDGVSQAELQYLSERAGEFPGVRVSQSYFRKYPYQSLAAQILGYTSEISADQLKAQRKSGYHAGDTIGQAGIESTYDSFLRGGAGLARLKVDAAGRPRGTLALTTTPRPGHALRLTIDIGLQRAAERAIRFGIKASGEWAANGGAIVAMDPRDGSVLALASYPTYKPSLYVGRVRTSKLAAAGLTNATAQLANNPSLNRAIDGTYPPGSTFKPVTALAAMQEHLVSPYQTLPCTASFVSPEDRGHHVFHNWDPYANSAMTLPTALAASCDTYFYQLGNDFYTLPSDRGHPLQQWASRFGFEAPTGIDLGPEAKGLLPTPEWRKQTFKTEIDRLWKPGDSIQLAIGQGDLTVTPLQLTRFYALLANGGKLVTPHLLMDVEQPGSKGEATRVLRPYTGGVSQPSGVDPAALQVVKDGLLEATHNTAIGTSAGIFGSFPIPVAGKTGTAEKVVHVGSFVGLKNQSWWCGYAPADNPTIALCSLIENGGHGGTAAAPAALQVFQQYFHTKAATVGPVKSD